MAYTWQQLLQAAQEAGVPDPPEDEGLFASAVHKPTGLKIVWFFDMGFDADYIEHFITPDGEIINFWNWPDDTPGREELIAYRG